LRRWPSGKPLEEGKKNKKKPTRSFYQEAHVHNRPFAWALTFPWLRSCEKDG